MAVGLTAACDSREDEHSGNPRPDQRAFWTIEIVDTLGSTEPTDSSLLRPVDFIVLGDTVWVADNSTPAIHLLSVDSGELVAIVGARGSGPAEFRDVSGIAASQHGDVAVADRRNNRITLFSSRGEHMGDIPTPSGSLGSVAYLGFDQLFATYQWIPGALDGQSVPLAEERHADGTSGRGIGTYVSVGHPLATRMHNRVRAARVSESDTWLLYPYRGILESWREGELIRVVELPRLASPVFSSSSSYVELDPNNPGRVSITRMPVADDIAVVDDGRLVVSLLRPRSDQAGYFSDLLYLTSNGDTLGRAAANFRAEVLRASGPLLYALCSTSCAYPVIVRFKVSSPRSVSR